MKYLVVPAAGGSAEQPTFDAALDLAETLGAHVVFLHVREDAVQVMTTMIATDIDGPIGTNDLTGELEREGAAQQARARQAVQQSCDRRHLALGAAPSGASSAEWVAVVGASPDRLILHARAADLVVMGPDARAGDMLSQVLVESGRPVLFVPAAPPSGLLDRVIVAWNDTAEAARAVTAAMPLLERAGSVAVVTVSDGSDPSAEESADRLAAALRHHTKAVAVTGLRTSGGSAGEVLLDAARADGATLLVMGGYSHSRLRQMVFGGFTRDILENAGLPVLIAH